MKYFKVVLGNLTEIAQQDKAMEVADKLVAQAGGGIPQFEECDEHGNPLQGKPTTSEPEKEVEEEEEKAVSQAEVVTAPAQTAPVYSDWGATKVDDAAKRRIENLHAAIDAAGGPKIDTKQQFFETGTRMAAIGYDTQRKREEEYLNKLPLREAIAELRETVGNEFRRDFHMTAEEIADDIMVQDNQVYVRDHLLTEHALQGIVTRLKSPALSYLLGLRSRIQGGNTPSARAEDAEMLARVLEFECSRNKGVEFKLRMREYPCDIYAALSPGFGVADAPMVMDQIEKEMPDDARGNWSYDQTTTHWELRASIWTPTPVDEQAVGEPFEGYVSLSSRDNGTGRFNGGGGINLLRCLNASVYNAGEASLSRVHRGKKMLFDVRTMIDKSLKAIHALCQAWGKARKSEVEIPEGLTLEEAMPGFWRTLLNQGELVLAGRKEHHIKGLTQKYFEQRRDEEKLVVADFGQAWTRYIQDQPRDVRYEAERAIGSWMVKPPRDLKPTFKEED